MVNFYLITVFVLLESPYLLDTHNKILTEEMTSCLRWVWNNVGVRVYGYTEKNCPWLLKLMAHLPFIFIYIEIFSW